MIALSPCRNGRAQCLTQCSHAAFGFKPHFTLSAKRPSHKAFTYSTSTLTKQLPAITRKHF